MKAIAEFVGKIVLAVRRRDRAAAMSERIKESVFNMDFITCPNKDHVNMEGWKSRQVAYIGNGIYKCMLCGMSLTRQDVINLIEDDYAIMVRELTEDYHLSLAKLFREKDENLGVIASRVAAEDLDTMKKEVG